MHAQGALLDNGVGPDGGDQIILADDLAAPRDQGHQDVERAAADAHGDAVAQQQALARNKLEGPEHKTLLVLGAENGDHETLTDNTLIPMLWDAPIQGQ